LKRIGRLIITFATATTGLALVVLLALGSGAGADSSCYTAGPPGSTNGCVTTTVVTTSVGAKPPVQAVAVSARTTGFALTGADIAGMVLVAGAALAAGFVLVAVSRRRRAEVAIGS
jgi:hypothetical protein